MNPEQIATTDFVSLAMTDVAVDSSLLLLLSLRFAQGFGSELGSV